MRRGPDAQPSGRERPRELLVTTMVKRASGLTLVELVIALLVAAILTTVAVPGLKSLMVDNDRATSHNQILSGLKLARSEAITRREDVTAKIEVPDGDGWGLTVSIVGGGEPLLSRSSSSDDIAVSEIDIIFNSLGRRSSDSPCIPDDCVLTIADNKLQITPAGGIEPHKDKDGDGNEEDGDEGAGEGG